MFATEQVYVYSSEKTGNDDTLGKFSAIPCARSSTVPVTSANTSEHTISLSSLASASIAWQSSRGVSHIATSRVKPGNTIPTNLNFLRTSSDSLAGIVTASINLRRTSSEKANAVHCTLAN